MDYPFIGMLQAFGFNYAPRDYAFCAGALMDIAQFTSLFALLGTQYGGDGRVSFRLPDLRGRVNVGSGQAPGFQLPYVQGHQHGSEAIALPHQQLPQHTHAANFTVSANLSAQVETSTAAATQGTPATGSYLGGGGLSPAQPIFVPGGSQGATVELGGVSSSIQPVGSVSLGVSGESDPVDIRQPQLAVSWCIALDGLWPSRN